MDRATDRRSPRRRMLTVLATLGLVAGMFVALAPGAVAVENTCKARNLTKDTPVRSNLQRVIKAASAGDTIAVKNVCVGHFKIGKQLILLGEAAPGHPRGVLDGNDVISSRSTLLVSARVTLTNLEITGGAWQPVGPASGGGGGIRNTGKLVLNNTLVRGNWSALNGGGVDNRGMLIMKGSSSVSGNMSDFDAGGIYNYQGTVVLKGSSSVTGNTAGLVSYGNGGGVGNFGEGVLILNDSSSVSGNAGAAGGGGIMNYGSITLNDSSSVTGNTADSDDEPSGGSDTGGGILNFECYGGSLTGTVDGGNVNDNYVGTAAPTEDNIALGTC